MQRIVFRSLLRLTRVLSLALLAALGAAVLTRYSPGYFTDARELDAAHAASARAQLDDLRHQQTSLPVLLQQQTLALAHADLGRSRQYDVPVLELLRQRGTRSAALLGQGLALGWLVALTFALPLSRRRGSNGEVLIAGSTSLLLAFPVAVLATLCLLLNVGGPVLVLALLIAVREFKLLYRLLRHTWQAPFLLHARAQGFSSARITLVHLAPLLGRELRALAIMSFILALSALVPLEVVFDLPGLGQLAWSGAMNRDLPVLIAITGVLAAAIAFASLFTAPERKDELSSCA